MPKIITEIYLNTNLKIIRKFRQMVIVKIAAQGKIEAGFLHLFIFYKRSERRSLKERRSKTERRQDWIRVRKWSSVYLRDLKIAKFLK
jgi:hypothetical protein